MQNLRLLLFQFYKPLLVLNLLFTGAAFMDIYINGIGQLGGSCFIKTAGYLTCIGFQYYFSNKTYFYFRNSGYTVRSLYFYTFLFDFLIYLIIIIIYFSFLNYFNVKS